MKRSRDARERIIELSTETIDDGNDRDRDARRNKTVLDSSSTRVIFEETQNELRIDSS